MSGLGVVFGAVEIAHIRAMSTPLGIALEAVLPFIGAIGLVVAGYALWTRRYVYDDSDVPRVVGWTITGTGGMALLFVWVLSHQLIRGATFHHAYFILVNNAIAGGLIGFVVGTYDARSKAYQRSVRRERSKHDFLNRQLRHHLLNGMNVVLGQVDLLKQQSGAASPEALSTIERRGNEMVDRIESVRTIARAFTEEGTAALDERDLSTILADVVERVDDRHREATVSADVPDGVSVYADRYLSTVFENLLSNAIEHGDEDSPRVRVRLTADEETAVVRIADDGPGLSDEQRESLFEWDPPTNRGTGMGVGLAIVKVLVDRYDGRIRMEDDDPTGTVAHVELVLAN